MKLSKLLVKLLELKNKPYYDSIKNYGVHGGEYLYQIAFRMDANTNYAQVLFILEGKSWKDCDVPHDMDLTLHSHKVNTISDLYALRHLDYKWLYKLWLKESKLKFDVKKVIKLGIPVFIIGEKDKDLREFNRYSFTSPIVEDFLLEDEGDE